MPKVDRKLWEEEKVRRQILLEEGRQGKGGGRRNEQEE